MGETQGQSDFGALFEAHVSKLRTNFDIGDKVEGVVTAIDRSSIFLDVNSRSDGVLDASELMERDGTMKVSVGDRVEAYCISAGEEGIRLTTKLTAEVADASLDDARANGIPVEGRVEGERKGGYEVKIASYTAFCPYSQIDLYRQEPAVYIGARFSFLIVEYSDNGRNIVVSRRRLLEQEQEKLREELRETLEVGQLIEGTVTRLMPFGAFVDIGGTEGLVHVSELSWGRNTTPEDILSEGEAVTVMIKDIDWEKNRIALSLKYAQGDPWNKLAESSTYMAGMIHAGTVTNIQPFGAFVELEPGIEGLVHISRLGAGRGVGKPEEVLTVGDHIEVSIESVDHERRRISLSMDNTLGSKLQDAEERVGINQEVAVGNTVSGIIDGITDFGVFIRLPNGRNGLLHVSQVEVSGSSNTGRALHRMFPIGDPIEVVVREITGDRVSLTLQAVLDREAESLSVRDLRDSAGGGLGSFGDMLDGLKL